MSEEEIEGKGGAEITATNLSFQLGTAVNKLAQGQIDYTILSVLEQKDIPFMVYAAIRSRKSRLWQTIYELYPRLKIGIGGRGRRDIIRMQGVSQGQLANVESEIQKPGIFERNIWNRGWRKEAEKDKF